MSLDKSAISLGGGSGWFQAPKICSDRAEMARLGTRMDDVGRHTAELSR